MQFTCATCGLPVKTSKYTCFDTARTSHRIHAIALNKACKSQVSSPAGCTLTYLQFAGEFTRCVIANCLQLLVILTGIAGIFTFDCGGIFSCVCSFFCLRLQLFLPAFGRYFYLRFSCLLANCMCFCLPKQEVFHWSRAKLHVKIPVKYPWYSGKFACACRQFACILREVLAASMQVNLPVLQVNCM